MNKARRKTLAHYGRGGKGHFTSVANSIAAERQTAACEAKSKGKKK